MLAGRWPFAQPEPQLSDEVTMAALKAPAPPATKTGKADATTPAPARDQLSDKQLAKAVLAGTLRPRAGEMRRLAEAVLAKGAPKPAKKKGKKAKSGKLAKIPQKRK
jgi:hypothetical protein